MSKFEEYDYDQSDVFEEDYVDNYDTINKLLLSDVDGNLWKIIDEYTKLDSRFDWFSLNDIYYGKYSNIKIDNDEIVVRFIYDFLDEVDNIDMICKNNAIEQEDLYYFNKLLSLNYDKLYSKVAYCFNVWC